MDEIPDTSADVLEYGLSADKPYLGTMSVLETAFRSFLSDLVELRNRAATDPALDRVGAIRLVCEGLQETLYGRNPAYAYGPWFSEQHLGRRLVDAHGLGGERSDAVLRCGGTIATELFQLLNEIDAGKLTDSEWQFRIDVMVEFWTHIFMGFPAPSADE